MDIPCLLLALAMTAFPATATTPTRTGGPHPVLAERFTTLDLGPGRLWGWQSTAYSRCTDNDDNPDSWKLDRLTPDALSTARGYLTITATAHPDGHWDTGLLTTGESCGTGGDGTLVRTGDLMVAHVLLPHADTGTWAGLWTWRDGHNEVDVFEWHADHPDTLEFVNHVRSGNAYYTDASVGAGEWLYIGTHFGADNTTWYVGPTLDHLTPVFADHTGVGADFAAYPILNLSISNGRGYHPAPATPTPATLSVDHLLIEHPAPDELPHP
ncbi:hypothetical protein FB465_1748 [Kitasatospora atroaurantiaca]|uniref:Glycosyl hydrolase family 16 n=2 Tax=Kitasatospora atroaurantiaca TaxID=285545 RepID=A0A561EMB4_9ACTN|nr:hypothetical protein FB465_1748 [Kitasatospora atroaurantiaca]